MIAPSQMMKKFVDKLLALDSSLYVTGLSIWDSVGNTTWGGPWIQAVAAAASCAVPYASIKAAREATWVLSWSVAPNVYYNSGLVGTESGDSAYLSVMRKHDKILATINDLGDKIQVKEEINPIDIARMLITFDDDGIKRLSSMKPRFRFLYLTRVHEIILLALENFVEKTLLCEFRELLTKLGDLSSYDKLFPESCSHGKVVELTSVLKIPRDLLTYVITYCYWNFYDVDDLNTISIELSK